MSWDGFALVDAGRGGGGCLCFDATPWLTFVSLAHIWMKCNLMFLELAHMVDADATLCWGGGRYVYFLELAHTVDAMMLMLCSVNMVACPFNSFIMFYLFNRTISDSTNSNAALFWVNDGKKIHRFAALFHPSQMDTEVSSFRSHFTPKTQETTYFFPGQGPPMRSLSNDFLEKHPL